MMFYNILVRNHVRSHILCALRLRIALLCMCVFFFFSFIWCSIIAEICILNSELCISMFRRSKWPGLAGWLCVSLFQAFVSFVAIVQKVFWFIIAICVVSRARDTSHNCVFARHFAIAICTQYSFNCLLCVCMRLLLLGLLFLLIWKPYRLQSQLDALHYLWLPCTRKNYPLYIFYSSLFILCSVSMYFSFTLPFDSSLSLSSYHEQPFLSECQSIVAASVSFHRIKASKSSERGRKNWIFKHSRKIISFTKNEISERTTRLQRSGLH